MSNDTIVTVQGWLAADPSVRVAGGHTVANFRIGCTPRRFHRGRQEWVDGETQWYSVSAWRTLAANCERSLHRGDPVVVQGRLQHRTYLNRNGVEVVALEIEALTVGHDLNRGVANFSKMPAKPREAPDDWAVHVPPVDVAPSDEPGAEPSEHPVTGPVPTPEEMVVGERNAA